MRLTQSLHRAVSVRPKGIGTVDGAQQRTWAEVHDRVRRLAGAMRRIGIERGDRVAVLSLNSAAFFEAYYAVLWAGAVLVPLNTRLSVAEIALQLKDAGVNALLFGAEFVQQVAGVRAEGLTRLLYLAMDQEDPSADFTLEELHADNKPLDDASGRDNDLAGIFYTGGTTGLPKGVMLSHNNLAAMAVNLVMALKVDEDCVNLHSVPMFHLADIGIVMTTMVGGIHVFSRQLGEDAMFDLIARWKVTHMFTVPAVIDRLAKHRRATTTDMSSLKVMGYGGAPMPTGTYETARAIFPTTDFVQGFGMTEMAAHTFLGPQYHRPGADPRKLQSAGQVCFGYELKVVGPDGRELPRGEKGELVGRGDNVMLGYWNRPEETAQALRDGWMHTQDAGYMDEDGFVYITDRFKDMVVSGAENIYSIEVENALSTHPAVDECAVIGVPDERWGERVHAVVVLKPGATLSLEDAVAHVRARIAGYKCPKSLEVRSAPLPRNPAGKVRKVDLRAPHWAGRTRNV